MVDIVNIQIVCNIKGRETETTELVYKFNPDQTTHFSSPDLNRTYEAAMEELYSERIYHDVHDVIENILSIYDSPTLEISKTGGDFLEKGKTPLQHRILMDFGTTLINYRS